MKIKEKVLKEVRSKGWLPEIDVGMSYLEQAIDLTLSEVEILSQESELKEMNDSGCFCGSFFNLIDGKFICNGCQEECENEFYQQFISKIRGLK